MIIVRIGRRGQITIPRQVRQALNLQEGDTLAVIPEGGQAILKPILQSLLDLRGSIQVSEPQDFDAIRKEVIAGRAKRAGHDQ